MAIIFKYKNAASLSYAPGFANAGADGEPGKQGVSGNTVYFVDYDLDNSYSIQLALQRIENNQLLSSTSNKTIEDRPYKENDLLMSKNGNIYRIILANQTSAQNYKFDIEYLGSFHDTNIPISVSKVVLYDITGSENYPAETYSPIFNNRTEKTIVDSSINLDDKSIHGLWLKLFLTVEITSNNPEVVEKYLEIVNAAMEKYSFSLTIMLATKKSLQGYSVPTEMKKGINSILDPSPDDLYQCIKTYKKLEFNNLCVIPVISSEYKNFDKLIEREKEYTETYNIGNKYSNKYINSFYLSDYSMDKMHPFGNNIRCTLDDNSSIWYKSGTAEKETGITSIDIDSLGDGYVFPYKDPDNTPTVTDTKYTKCEYSDVRYFYNTTGNKDPNFSHSELTVDLFNDTNYAIGKTLTTHTKADAQHVLNTLPEQDTNLVQTSLRYVDGANVERNLRSGDTAYFSSIDENKVKDEIAKYLKNSAENKYILTIKNKKTKEITTSEIPVEFYTL